MSVLNLASCDAVSNVGAVPCSFNPSFITRFVLVPKGTSISAATMADNATLLAAFQAGFINDSPALRWRQSGILSNLEDQTDGVKEEDRNGVKYVTQDPPYQFEYLMTLQFGQFLKWLTYQQSQNKYDVIFIDTNGAIIGKAGTSGAMKGIPLSQLFFHKMKIATTDTLPMYKVRFSILNNADLNQNAVMVNAGYDATAYDTLLQDITIEAGATTPTSTHIYFKAFYDYVGGRANIGDLYGDVLDAVGAWIITDDGSVITPSALAYDATLKEFDATVTAITSGHTVTVLLQVPSVATATPYFANLESPVAYSYTSP